MTTSSRLEKLGQLTFIVMCLTVSGAAGVHMLAARRAAVPSSPPPPLEAGKQLTLPAAATDSGRSASLLLILSTKCPFCTDSMPFYSNLSALPAVRSGRVRLSVVSLQPSAVMREYLDQHGVPVSAVFTVPEAGLAVNGTPTLVITDSKGVVAGSWLGLLPPAEEKRVLATLETITK